jgi:site-specific DNA-methyltransferase (adenine-specific)
MQDERSNKLVFIKKNHINYIEDNHKQEGFRYQNDFLEHMVEFYQQYSNIIKQKSLKLEPNQIYNGDCLALMPLIPDRSVDLVIADLPYQVTNCSWDIMIDIKQLWIEYERIIKDNGAILLFAQPPFNAELIKSNSSLFRYEWIWEKSHSTGHLNAKKMPMRAHENILVFYKKLPTYNPQKTLGHVKKQVKIESRKKKVTSGIWNAAPNFQEYSSTERYPRSVLRFASDRQKIALHPVQKPVALIEYILRTYSNEGDLVLDNCSGSGSLAIAALNTNRKYICIEKDQEFYNLSVQRIANHNRMLQEAVVFSSSDIFAE